MEYDNSNSGVLFKNDKKETEKHPDYTGTMNADGQDFWLSAWVKTSKAGKKFFSLALTPKEVREPAGNEEPDDIPF